MHTSLRLLSYEASRPTWNMAVDAALLESAHMPTVRFYGWAPPAVSIGWFQRGLDCTEFRRAGYLVVQRMTGGGAVVHHHELTYSVLLPVDHPWIAQTSTRESYDRVHAPIAAALATHGVEVGARQDESGATRARDTMCFARATHLDLVAGGRKLVGSAQRRRPGWVLQHGSIILARTELQSETAAMNELTGRTIDPGELADTIVARIRDAGMPVETGSLTAGELDLARRNEPGFEVN